MDLKSRAISELSSSTKLVDQSVRDSDSNLIRDIMLKSRRHLLPTERHWQARHGSGHDAGHLQAREGE
jgi:hypothetical protein